MFIHLIVQRKCKLEICNINNSTVYSYFYNFLFGAFVYLVRQFVNYFCVEALQQFVSSAFCFLKNNIIQKMERDCCEFICGAPTTFRGYGIE